MPYSNAPVVSTYSTHRVPLVQSHKGSLYQGLAGTTTDKVMGNLMVNVLPKKYKTEAGTESVVARARAGILSSANPVGATSTATCRGLYVWEKTLVNVYFFYCVNNTVFTSQNINGPWTGVNTWTNSGSTPCRFTEFVSSTNVKSLVLVDGFEAIVFTTNAAGTKVVDVDFPTPHVPFPIFLNGRIHLAKLNTGDIYCSDLDNPASWTPGSFLSSEVYPDDIQALVKIDNYILAIGLVGSEYFLDAGNSPGSPLARVENSSLPFGTDYANTIASTLNAVCFLSKSPDGNVVLRTIDGFRYKNVECDFLNAIIPQEITTVQAAVQPTGHFFRDAGELYYTLVLQSQTNSDTVGVWNSAFTYVFDADIWVAFSRGADTSNTTYGYNAHKSYPVLFSSPGYGGSSTIVAGQAFNSPFIGVLDEVLRGQDTLYINSASVTSTLFVPTSVTVTAVDAGTMNRKFMTRLGLDYTNEGDDGSDYFLPRVTWWDTDVKNVTATPVKLASGATNANGGNNFPFITQLGQFRKRWIRVEGYGAVTWRHLEFDINKGQR